MALTINTNIDSLNAQRNLTTSKSSLSQALQRLSSGLKINSAADDAAGLAIAANFTTQINGTNQAVKNANDAISESQTAGGALSTLTDNLQSIRTLAVESANGSNSASDRAALDAQVQQQIAEITRIASQTNFNGTKVLDGSSGVTVFQVGANVGNTIAINLTQGVRADQIGQVASKTGAVTTVAGLTGSALTLQVGTGTAVSIGASSQGSANLAGNALAGESVGSAYSKVAAINAAGVAGLTASANTTATGAAAFGALTGTAAGTVAANGYALNVNGTDIYAATNVIASGATLAGADVVKQINLYSSQTGVTASLTGTGALSLNAADGRDINVKETVGTALGGAGAVVAAGVASGAQSTTQGKITLSASNNITIGGGDSAALGYQAGGDSISLQAQTLANANVLTVTGANATIQAVDSALATVSSLQSQLGAIQNRFTSTVSNLQSTVQNLTASRSTIQDADFAAETAKLTQSNVLQQAGISVLAQANQAPQLILKLLQ
jgi:flagellin